MNFLGLAFAEGGVFDPGSAVGVCCFPGSGAGCLNCEGVFLNISPAGHPVESFPRLTRRRFLPGGDGGEQPLLAIWNVGGSMPTFATSPMFPSWETCARSLRSPASASLVEKSSVTVLGTTGFASKRSCKAGSSRPPPTPPDGESRLQSARDEVIKRKSTKCHDERACSMMGFGRDKIRRKKHFLSKHKKGMRRGDITYSPRMYCT